MKSRTSAAPRFLATALAALMAAGSAPAQVQPSSPTVVSGQASFQRAGSVYSITNTPGAIIQWQGFSIGADQTTRFLQQSASSTVLNRIVGQDPSVILGTLQSNGRVILVNPNGVLFGAGSRVDVNGLIASSLALSNQDFLAGRMNFSAGSTAGRVANEGRITTPGGGSVYLVAPSVGNSGVIHAPGGEVVLAAGRSVQLVDSRDPDLHVVVSAPGDQALNLGQVLAEGGRIGIYGGLVNQRGLVSADSAVVGADGRIVFKASGDLLLETGSLTSATGAAKGGAIQLLGNRVGLMDNARVDASGETGGGSVQVGSDGREGAASIPVATQVMIGRDASIRADALQSGDGGTVIVASQSLARMHGSISARGGNRSGDGGFVEVSGAQLEMSGRVDTRAPHGRIGQLLLDPTNIYIANDQASATTAGMSGTDAAGPNDLNEFGTSAAVSDSLLTVGTLQENLAVSMVTVSTENGAGTGAGFIRVVDPVTWTSDTTLSLRADAGIAIDAPITGGNGSMLALRTFGGDINQSAAIVVSALVARADVGSVNLTHIGNRVGRLAGHAGGTGGFSFSGAGFNGGALTIGPVESFLAPETGITSAGAGPVNLTVTGDLALMGNVTSGSGNITVAASGAYTSQATVSSTSGRITIQGVVVQPNLADCTANPALAGCAAILPTLSQCVASPTLQGCSAVLPPVSACVANPAAAGCSVVVPPTAPTAPSGGVLAVIKSLGQTVVATTQASSSPASLRKVDEKKEASIKLAGDSKDVRKKTYCN